MKKQFLLIFLGVFMTTTLCAEEDQGYYGPMGRFRMNLFPGVTGGVLQGTYGGVQGERIVMEDRFGMDTSRTIPEIELAIGITPMAQLYATGAYGVFPGSETLTQNLFFEGTSYLAGSKISFVQHMGTVEGGLLIDAIRGPAGFLQFGMGLRYGVFHYKIDGMGLPTAKGTYEGLFPTVRTRANLRIFGFTFLYLDMTLGGIDYEKHNKTNFDLVERKKFWYFNLQAGLKFALVPGVDFFIGYFRNQFQIYKEEDKLVQRVNFSFQGMAFSFEVKL